MNSSLSAFVGEVIQTTSDQMVHSNCRSLENDAKRGAQRHPLIEKVTGVLKSTPASLVRCYRA